MVVLAAGVAGLVLHHVVVVDEIVAGEHGDARERLVGGLEARVEHADDDALAGDAELVDGRHVDLLEARQAVAVVDAVAQGGALAGVVDERGGEVAFGRVDRRGRAAEGGHQFEAFDHGQGGQGGELLAGGADAEGVEPAGLVSDGGAGGGHGGAVGGGDGQVAGGDQGLAGRGHPRAALQGAGGKLALAGGEGGGEVGGVQATVGEVDPHLVGAVVTLHRAGGVGQGPGEQGAGLVGGGLGGDGGRQGQAQQQHEVRDGSHVLDAPGFWRG